MCSFLPKMAGHGTSAASSSCSASHFHPGEAQKRDLPFGFQPSEQEIGLLVRARESLSCRAGAEHTTVLLPSGVRE